MLTELQTSIVAKITAQYPGLEFKFTLLRDEFDVYKNRNGMSVWAIHLTRNGYTYTTEYSMGAAHRVYAISRWSKKPSTKRISFPARLTQHDAEQLEASLPCNPELADVLYCLTQDASTVDYGATFEDWCGEFGYDTDSRSAKKAFNQCRDTYHALKRLGLDLAQLSELFRDY